MRVAPTLLAAALTLAVAACQSPTAPDALDEWTPDVVSTQQQTGPDNACYGHFTSDVASTWPWAHGDERAFPPPPGAIALWVSLFGSDLSVREVQHQACG